MARIAAIQAAPVFMDRDATIDKACDYIARVGKEGGGLAVFPEAFVPGYPLWVWFIPSGKTHALRELYAELLEQAVAVPSESTDRLCEAARQAGVTVAIGISEVNVEASGSTLYNTILYIGPDGTILGKHRKLVPTAGERLVWGMGDGSDLDVYPTPVGRVGGLVCWENYMPLARYALAAWGEEIHVAPTWDRGEPWLSTMRHIAKEGRCFVVGCCSAMHIDDIPDRFDFKRQFMADVKEIVNPGLSVIVDPDGKIVAGPSEEREHILWADVDRARITGPRWQLDIAGHYARPDVFELIVHRQPRDIARIDSMTTRIEPGGVSSTITRRDTTFAGEHGRVRDSLRGASIAMIPGGTAGPRDRARDEAAVRGVERAYDAAWNSGDITALVALFATDAVLMNPRGEIARGRAEIERVMRRFLGGAARKSSHTSVVSDVHLLTDDVAIVDGEATLEGLVGPDGASCPPLVHQFTDVIARTDGTWSIAHVRAYVVRGVAGNTDRTPAADEPHG